ncbi:MAG: tetratricopeptide repeat protein [Pseudomonadota bacterium]
MTRHARNASLLLLFASAAAFAQEEPAAESALAEPDTTTLDDTTLATDSATLPIDQTVPVADAEEVPTAPPPSDEELLQAEFDRYRQLISDGVLDEADSTAKRVIELAIRTSGPDSVETARALSNLGTVQYRMGQYESAAQNYQSAITIIEEVEDRLHTSLINPIRGLGASQLASGRPDLAAQTFSRGVHITHVNDGPHNMGQVELLETLAESRLRMGLIDDAKTAHESIYALNLRFFQSNPMDMVPSLMRRASWQNRTGYIFDERSTYRHVIRIIESSTSKTDVNLIPPLTRMGRSFFYPDRSGIEPYAVDSVTSGELYFKRALRIARESPESDWDILSGALIAIADYNMMLPQSRLVRAKNHYEEAWTLLAENNEGKRKDKLRSEFGKPRELKFFSLPKFAGSATAADRANPDVALREGSIRFSYDVSERGKIANFKIIEANPSEFYDVRRSVIREMRSRQYRPRFENGTPVVTTGLIDTHRFLYKQSDLMALRRQEEAEQEEETQEEPADTEKGT